jgi:hypothetical protein
MLVNTIFKFLQDVGRPTKVDTGRWMFPPKSSTALCRPRLDSVVQVEGTV